ncbi:SAND domain-containing protein [Chloropicon primus]|nr:SAND domain-containing protein [Chloropicon primus]
MIAVVCNGFAGEFDPHKRVFFYPRRSALQEGERAHMYTPTEFERYAGMAASKKWKYSVRIDVAAEPGMQWNVHALGPCTLGKWLEDNGFDKSGGRGGRSSSNGRARSAGAQSGSGSASAQMATWPASPRFGEGAQHEWDPSRKGGTRNPAGGGEHHSRWLAFRGAKHKEAAGDAAMVMSHPAGGTFGLKNKHGGGGEGLRPRPRIGSAFQAEVGDCLTCEPKDDPDNLAHPEREGKVLFESEAAARESAQGFEKEGARALPLSAIYDLDDSSDDENSVLYREKSTRTRKRPKWLQGSISMFDTENEAEEPKHGVRAQSQQDQNDEDTPRSRNRNAYFGKFPAAAGRKSKRDYFVISKIDLSDDNTLRVVITGREGEKWAGSLGPSCVVEKGGERLAKKRPKQQAERSNGKAVGSGKERDGRAPGGGARVSHRHGGAGSQRKATPPAQENKGAARAQDVFNAAVVGSGPFVAPHPPGMGLPFPQMNMIHPGMMGGMPGLPFLNQVMPLGMANANPAAAPQMNMAALQSMMSPMLHGMGLNFQGVPNAATFPPNTFNSR